MSEVMGNTHSAGGATLYLAFELGEKEWKLGFTVGLGQKPRERTMAAGDVKALEVEIELAKKRFGLPGTVEVQSCYEAGRDGFWLHRDLVAHRVNNVVVDSASIEVNRRAKRAKTDRLDVGQLLKMRMRYTSGEKKVWSVVHVPSVEAEDRRHVHRELLALKAERTRHSNRIKGLLVGQGVRLAVKADFLERLEAVRLWDGALVPAGLRARLEHDAKRAGWQFATQHVNELEAQRSEQLRHSDAPEVKQVRQRLRRRGIGDNSAWLYVREFFSWRDFHNRRQVGGLAGLSPTPYQSGDEEHEQGISKAGNNPVRAMAIEIAWSWVRHQPQSELSQWCETHLAHGSRRVRKIGIVALARQLLVALWRYLETGELPAGALLKPADGEETQPLTELAIQALD
jgi:transposase